jgi:hypothetical protein
MVMSQRRRRDPQLEQSWRERIAAWEKSGQSARAFCAHHQLQEACLYSWRRTLRERARERPAAKESPSFVPLRVIPDAVVEVVLPSGLVVRVPAGADAAAVVALVAALRTATC